MALFVLSDLHLDEEGQARLFRDDRQGAKLATLCERMARDGAEVVLLGDIFDFTAMNPPARGLDRFFAELGVAGEPKPARDVRRLLEAVRESNPRAVSALAHLSRRVPITLVPGNHDHHLGAPGAKEALAAIGLVGVRIEPLVVREIAGRRVVLRHGHELDPGNAKPGGPGEMLTASLHQAAIPFLRQRGGRTNVRIDPDRLVALRPEEFAVPVLERWLAPDTFRAFFRAFLRLLAANGAVPRPAAWIVPFLSSERMRKRIQDQDQLWNHSGRVALRALRGRGPVSQPQPDLLVMGHTHVLDWAPQDGEVPSEKLYVNMGTWTDRAADANSAPDTTLPVLELWEEAGRLRARLSDLDDDGGEMQTFDAPARFSRT
ncbi:MAG: metallophosphoesterase [Myxococcales bacterium]